MPAKKTVQIKKAMAERPVELNYAMIGDDFEVYHKSPEVMERAAKALGRKPTENDRGKLTIELTGETFERAKRMLSDKGFTLLPMP